MAIRQLLRVNNRRALLLLSCAAFMLSGFSIVLADLPVAEWLRRSGFENYWLFAHGTQLLDRVFGMEIHVTVAGSVLLVSGSLILLAKRTQRFAAILIFVALSNLISIASVQLAKLAFGRLRPYELLADAPSSPAWFLGGESFPSGHAGFYWGLFLPLIFLFPRYKWPLLVIPLFISLARVIGNHHFVSDVLASLGLVALITLILAGAMKRRLSGQTY